MENDKSKESTLQTYLLSRGLLNPKDVTDAIISGKTDIAMGEEILVHDDLLEQCANIQMHNRKGFEALLRSRITPLAMELIVTAVPEETIVLRQAIMEISSLLTDLDKLAGEYVRRNEAKEVEEKEVNEEKL
jgi:hypothetical protein